MGSTRRGEDTSLVQAGQWLVFVPGGDGDATVLSVESSEQDALDWRAELVRRIIATPDSGFLVLSTTDGRVLFSSDLRSVHRSVQRFEGLPGPRELIVARAETPLLPLRCSDSPLHQLLPGRFPA
ncbi:MAG: hypothetical protein ACTHZX_11790 [Microbacterium sp.]